VARFAARRTAPDLVDDIVAETFATAWRRIGDIPDDAVPWLFAVARHVIGTAGRTQARRHRLGARLAREPAPLVASAEEVS
jgi:RNA polymerase sigma-70 factor (ECF subfamily)